MMKPNTENVLKKRAETGAMVHLSAPTDSSMLKWLEWPAKGQTQTL